MKERYGRACILMMVGLGVVAALVRGSAATALPGEGESPKRYSASEHWEFARKVNLEPLRRLAVFQGRVKILDTLARETVHRAFGKERWQDLSAEAAGRGRKYDPVFTYLDWVFCPAYYQDRPVVYIRSAALRTYLLRALGLEGQELERWKRCGRLTLDMVQDRRLAEAVRRAGRDRRMQVGLDQAIEAWHSFATAGLELALISPAAGGERWRSLKEIREGPIGAELWQQWATLAEAWQRRDAEGVSRAAEKLADMILKVEPETYPPAWRRELELWYNRTQGLTVGYAIYLAAAVFLGAGLIRGWKTAARIGWAVAVVGWLVHLSAVGVRGLLAGRWPVHNLYESMLVGALFAVAFGMGLGWMKKMYVAAIAGLVVGAGVLFVASGMDMACRQIGPVPGILVTTQLLHWHVNTIMLAYGLIGVGFVLSTVYLGTYYGWSFWSGKESEPRILEELDRAQNLVLRTAFWLLGIGILLGAYWADRAWGRWWGWDPKETWALVSWVVYLMLVHVRGLVQKPGPVTAWLSVVGFLVVLWTYWGVSLVLPGLHSYI